MVRFKYELLNQFVDLMRANAHKFVQSKPRKPIWDGTKIRDHLTEEDYKSIDQEISKQIDARNDRGVAIVSAAFVEDRLRWLIESNFVEEFSSSKRKWLFAGAGPLSSLLAKIELGYALGYFTKDLRDQMRLIGEIRNRFAHTAHEVKFSDADIKEKCLRLRKENEIFLKSETDPMRIYGVSCTAVTISLFVMGQFFYRTQNKDG